ncbi:coiled-coil domain-containing protein [Novosphingobium beihaiensis]|uniref:Uncharacterized protein n=1 Tax=Novosphingobium beihaiensis TaxID=2930389 RepID=A0ABT0BNE3_9SPHN|nr:hypothetical protein [Novosphingobium beihaiensis]MCJ2186239.1 hypothetical protein [Novosphingobium beihaiensis]
MTVSQEAQIKRNQIPAQYRADGANGGLLKGDFAIAGERQNLDAEGARSKPFIPRDGAFSHSEYELLSQALATTLGEDENAAVMLSGAQQQKRISDKEINGRKRREREQRYLAILDAIDAHIARLDARIAEINLEFDRINARRTEIGDQLEALDELERLNASGKLDPRNAEHQRLMKKSGIPPNTSAADIAMLIDIERAHLSDEDDTLEQQSNDLIRERGELQTERDEALAVREALENADTPEALEIAAQRANDILSASQLGILASQTDDSATAQAAGDLVAKADERDPEANAQHTSEAAERDRASIYSTDAANFRF